MCEGREFGFWLNQSCWMKRLMNCLITRWRRILWTRDERVKRVMINLYSRIWRKWTTVIDCQRVLPTVQIEWVSCGYSKHRTGFLGKVRYNGICGSQRKEGSRWVRWPGYFRLTRVLCVARTFSVSHSLFCKICLGHLGLIFFFWVVWKKISINRIGPLAFFWLGGPSALLFFGCCYMYPYNCSIHSHTLIL